MITEFDLKVEKMRKYCLFTDRCHQDVRSKLIKEKIYGQELEEIMAVLIEEDFLNEERFAKAFVKGKFKQNKWGKKRILMELKQRKISPYCIRKGFEELEEEEYDQMILRLWKKKWQLTKGKNDFEKKQKVIRYLTAKGYEYQDIQRVVGETI